MTFSYLQGVFWLSGRVECSRKFSRCSGETNFAGLWIIFGNADIETRVFKSQNRRWFECAHRSRPKISSFKVIARKRFSNLQMVKISQTIASVRKNIAIQTEIDRGRESAWKTTSRAVTAEGETCLVPDLLKDLLLKTSFWQLSTCHFWRTGIWISQQLLRVGCITLAFHSCRNMLRVDLHRQRTGSTVRFEAARFCAPKRAVKNRNFGTL